MVSSTTAAASAVEVVKSLSLPPRSPSLPLGSSVPTTICASSATKARPRQATKKFQRMRGTTEVSHRGRIPWTTRTMNQVTRIIAPIPRFSPSRVSGPTCERSALSMKLSIQLPLWKNAKIPATTT